MLKRFLIVLVLAVCLGLLVRGCTSSGRSSKYLIAYDPSWYPINVVSKENNLAAFSEELLREIGKDQGFSYRLVKVASVQLIRGLVNGDVDAVLSVVQPTIVTEGRFHMSDSYFDMGPVLVVPVDSTINGMAQLVGHSVGIRRAASKYHPLLSNGLVKISPFATLTEALDALIDGEVAAVLMPGIQAVAFQNGIYRGVIRVASKPLNNEGLRLLSAKSSAIDLIDSFNKGLQKLREDGRYDKLLTRWDVP